jgi:FkbM family methyltransferase
MKARRLASSFVHRAVLPLTPAHRRLTVLAWSNRKFEETEPELIMLDRLVPPGCRTAVDAGANIGLYTLRLAGLCRSVHAFEINAAITDHVHNARLPNVRLVHMGLSNADDRATLYVPILNGKLALHGWASLNPGNCPDTSVHTEISCRVRTLDSYAIEDVDFIKIDVEGHELQLLQGARATLERWRPRILVEVRNLPSVTAFFSDLGYRHKRPEDFGVSGSPPWMHVFDAR